LRLAPSPPILISSSACDTFCPSYDLSFSAAHSTDFTMF